jgi:hypothetical protein
MRLSHSRLYMKESVTEIIYMWLAATFFIFGLAYALSTITILSAEFDEAKGTEGTTFIKETEIPEEVTYSGAEVIGSLYKLNFDEIMVDFEGQSIISTKDFNRLQPTIGPTNRYSMNFVSNNDGIIVKLAVKRIQ